MRVMDHLGEVDKFLNDNPEVLEAIDNKKYKKALELIDHLALPNIKSAVRYVIYQTCPQILECISYGSEFCGEFFFAHLEDITTFNMPEGAKYVPSWCFTDCINLTDIKLNNVRGIACSAFQGCTSLENIIIPESLDRISFDAFEGCVKLKKITFLGEFFIEPTDYILDIGYNGIVELSVKDGELDNYFKKMYPKVKRVYIGQ